jgi:hypothetical protein
MVPPGKICLVHGFDLVNGAVDTPRLRAGFSA